MALISINGELPANRLNILAKVYYDKDADLNLLKGKVIAVIGYGNQGRGQAQNLKDSSCQVVVGLHEGSKIIGMLQIWI